MTKSYKHPVPITANIATYSGRVEYLPDVLDTLKNQTVKLDKIRVFYNDYVPEPEPGVEQHWNGFDYTDRAKFIWLDEIRLTGKHEIYFSCDDDIYYPPDYIETTLRGMKKYPGCYISYHGRKLAGLHRSYYRGHKWYHCLGEVKDDHFIDVPGTGVGAFDTRCFMPDVINYNQQKMVDLIIQ